MFLSIPLKRPDAKESKCPALHELALRCLLRVLTSQRLKHREAVRVGDNPGLREMKINERSPAKKANTSKCVLLKDQPKHFGQKVKLHLATFLPPGYLLTQILQKMKIKKVSSP